MPAPTCSNCRFFRRDPQPTCHQGPPLGHAFIVPRDNPITGRQELAPQTIGYWPMVREGQWCGSHEPAPEAPPPADVATA